MPRLQEEEVATEGASVPFKQSTSAQVTESGSQKVNQGQVAPAVKQGQVIVNETLPVKLKEPPDITVAVSANRRRRKRKRHKNRAVQASSLSTETPPDQVANQGRAKSVSRSKDCPETTAGSQVDSSDSVKRLIDKVQQVIDRHMDSVKASLSQGKARRQVRRNGNDRGRPPDQVMPKDNDQDQRTTQATGSD